jgi:hypothetical protein
VPLPPRPRHQLAIPELRGGTRHTSPEVDPWSVIPSIQDMVEPAPVVLHCDRVGQRATLGGVNAGDVG